jgi:hypothetical protein
VFGVPLAHEDDALRATRAAHELREAAAAEGDAVRVGVATGEALVDTGDMPVVGDVVSSATALRDGTVGGGVLISAPTHALVRDAVTADDETAVGPRRLAARRVEAVRGARGSARRLDTPFVGRDAELALLREALGKATEEQRCVAVTVVGEAGIGKTRLAEQLAAMLVRGRALHGQCLSYGAGSAFAPIVEIFERAGLPAQSDNDAGGAASTITALADPRSAVPVGETFWAVRRVVESVAGDDPLVLVVDDIHWAEPTLLDLIEYLAQRVSASVVLLCLSRPELLRERPDWGGGDTEMRIVTLGPLDDDAAGALLEGIGTNLDEGAHVRIAERAGGNPLHLEQLAVYASEDGGARLDEVPPTIEAVLASRIDELSPDARDVLQRASITQRLVRRGLVVALSEPDARVDTSLLELTRRGLLHVARSEGPDDLYRFHHALLRDVAYRSMPKARRAALHERAAAWWAETEIPAPDDLIGWHLERAHDLCAELQPDDPGLPRLAEAAGARLGAAGIRAAKASDPALTSLLSRATALLSDGPFRAELLVELGPWLRTFGDVDASRRSLEEALRVADSAGEEAVAARARLELAWAESAIRTTQPMSAFRDLAAELLPALEAAGNERGLMRAWQLLSWVHLYDGQMEAMATASEEADRHARAADWPSRMPTVIRVIALVNGEVPASRAVEEAESLLRGDGVGQDLWSGIATGCATLHAMVGRHERAAELMSAARATFVALDDQLALLTSWSPNRLMQLRLMGDRNGAYSHAERWVDELRAARNDAFLATALVELADLVVDADGASAPKLLDEATERAAVDDRFVQALIRSTSAKHSAARGDAFEVGRLAVEAKALLEQADVLNHRARVAVATARAWDICGDTAAAASALSEAADLYGAKGNETALEAIARDRASALT